MLVKSIGPQVRSSTRSGIVILVLKEWTQVELWNLLASQSGKLQMKNHRGKTYDINFWPHKHMYIFAHVSAQTYTHTEIDDR